MQIPQILKNFNLMVSRVNYAGKIDEVRLPALTLKEEDHRGGGMDAAVGIDMGMEKLEIGFTSAEHNPAIYRQFGVLSGNALQGTLRAAASDDKTWSKYRVEFEGHYREIGSTTLAAGEKAPLEATVSLRFYALYYNDQELIYIDVMNAVRRIGGVDVLAGMRAALAI